MEPISSTLAAVSKAALKTAEIGTKAAFAAENVNPAAQTEGGADVLAAGARLAGSLASIVPVSTDYATVTGPVMGALGKFDVGTALDSLTDAGLISKDTVFYDGIDSVRGVIDSVKDSQSISFLVDKIEKVPELEMQLHEALDARGLLLTAKNTTHIVGNDYTAGMLTKLPLGSVVDLGFKTQLGVEITTADLVRAGVDVAVVVACVVAPIAIGAAGATAAAGTAAEASAVAAESAGITGVLETAGGQATVMATEGLATSSLASTAAGAEAISAGSGAAEALSPIGTLEATQAEAWATGANVKIGARIHPGDFAARFRELDANLPANVEHLYRTDPVIRSTFDKYAQRFADSLGKGVRAELNVRTDVKRNVSGEVARRLTDRGFAPYFSGSEFEPRIPVGDSYTKADIILNGAKADIAIRPGNVIPKGGSMHVETKAGLKGYFLQQVKEHLPFQAEARRITDGSMTIVTKNISDLEVAVEERVRGAMRDSSPIYKFLPRKERLDAAITRSIIAKARQLATAV